MTKVDLARKKAGDYSYLGIAAFFILYYLYMHFRAGFTFPVPWVDEGHYLFPGLSFLKQNTFLGSPLGEPITRILLPPVHTVLMGCLFKFSGFDVMAVRHVSGLAIAGGFISLFIVSRDYFQKHVSLILCGLFLLNKFFIISGNNGRMESLVIFLACLGLYFLHKDEDYKGLSLLAIAPFVHPNGLFFLAAGGAFVLLKPLVGFSRKPTKRSDWIFVIAALSVISLAVIYLAYHWDAFRLGVIDIQVKRKLDRNLFALLFVRGNFIYLILMSLMGVVLLRFYRRGILLLLFCGAAWCVNRMGQEMWYDVYDSFSQLLLSLLFLQCALKIIHQTVIWDNVYFKRGAAAFFLGLVLFWNYQLGMIENMWGYPKGMRWYGMEIVGNNTYIDQADVDAVRNMIERVHQERDDIVVRFYPDGNTIFFQDLVDPRTTFYFPLIEGDRNVDLTVYHFSPFYPWNGAVLKKMQEQGQGAVQIIHRDEENDEKWFYVVHPLK